MCSNITTIDNAASVQSIGVHDLHWRSNSPIVAHETSVVDKALVNSGRFGLWVLGEGCDGSVSALSNGRIVLDVVGPHVVIEEDLNCTPVYRCLLLMLVPYMNWLTLLTLPYSKAQETTPTLMVKYAGTNE